MYGGETVVCHRTLRDDLLRTYWLAIIDIDISIDIDIDINIDIDQECWY